MTIDPQQASRVRCRAIAESDLDGLADLLARGFPRSRRDYWTAGFARWKNLPVIEGVPRFGYVLDGGLGPVGVILLISSQRGEQIISNLSSWYVEPQWRTHSTLLISMATKLKHVTYLNASPAPHTWRTLQAQSFQPYNFGRSAVFGSARPRHGQRDHSRTICRKRSCCAITAPWAGSALVVEKDGIVSPFVFKPRRLDKPPVPVMDVMFCRAPEDFRRCLPALARHFLPRGRLGFLIDGDMPGMLSHYAEGKEPRYFKGPYRPVLGDLAYTEKVLFG